MSMYVLQQKVYNESAWKDDVTNRTEWYLQQFGPDTANLNLRSNRVREELEVSESQGA